MPKWKTTTSKRINIIFWDSLEGGEGGSGQRVTNEYHFVSRHHMEFFMLEHFLLFCILGMMFHFVKNVLFR
jgi:hypothetical protein